MDCEETKYCLGGEASPRGLCPPGYYCPKNTKFAEEYPCNNRTYNPNYGLSTQSQCENCTLGHFCEKGTVHPYECSLGTYMPYGENPAGDVIGTPAGYQSDCLVCPGGLYCLNATVTPKQCNVGFYTKPGQSVCEVSFMQNFS